MPQAKGDVVLCLNGPIVDRPTRTSIELGEGMHVEDELGRFVNHSSDPTCVVDRKDSLLRAARSLRVGDEITFDYNENETHVVCPFVDLDTNVKTLFAFIFGLF